MYALLESWAKIAGIAGISIGAVLLIFRPIIAKVAQPGKSDSFKLLRLMIVLIWIIGISGMVIWFYIAVFVPPKDKSAYVIDSVKDTINFAQWKPVVLAPPRDCESPSIVTRKREVRIRRVVATDVDFIDRATTTGCWIKANFFTSGASFNEVPRLSGRSAHEYLTTVPHEAFNADGTFLLKYELTYANGWKVPTDSWVGKTIQFPTSNYSFVINFPKTQPWKSMQVCYQPPGAADQKTVASKKNEENGAILEWACPPSQIMQPGSRIVVNFDWPPLGPNPITL